MSTRSVDTRLERGSKRRRDANQVVPGIDNRLKNVIEPIETPEPVRPTPPPRVMEEPPVPPESLIRPYGPEVQQVMTSPFDPSMYTATPAEMVGKYGYQLRSGEPTRRMAGPGGAGPMEGPFLTSVPSLPNQAPLPPDMPASSAGQLDLPSSPEDQFLKRMLIDDYMLRSRFERQARAGGNPYPAFKGPRYYNPNNPLVDSKALDSWRDESSEPLQMLTRIEQLEHDRRMQEMQFQQQQQMLSDPRAIIGRAALGGGDPIATIQGWSAAQKLVNDQGGLGGQAPDGARMMFDSWRQSLPGMSGAEQRAVTQTVLGQMQQSPFFAELREKTGMENPGIEDLADHVMELANNGGLNERDLAYLSRYLQILDAASGRMVEPTPSWWVSREKQGVRQQILDLLRQGVTDPDAIRQKSEWLVNPRSSETINLEPNQDWKLRLAPGGPSTP